MTELGAYHNGRFRVTAQRHLPKLEEARGPEAEPTRIAGNALDAADGFIVPQIRSR